VLKRFCDVTAAMMHLIRGGFYLTHTQYTLTHSEYVRKSRHLYLYNALYKTDFFQNGKLCISAEVSSVLIQFHCKDQLFKLQRSSAKRNMPSIINHPARQINNIVEY